MFRLEETSVFFPFLPKWEWTATSPLRSSDCGVSFPVARLALEIQMQSCPFKIDRKKIIDTARRTASRGSPTLHSAGCFSKEKGEREFPLLLPPCRLLIYFAYLYVHQESPPPAVWMGLGEWRAHVAINFFLNGRRHGYCVQKLLPLCARRLKSVTMVYVLLQMGYASHQFLPHTKSIGRLQLAGSLPKDSFCSNIAFIKI